VLEYGLDSEGGVTYSGVHGSITTSAQGVVITNGSNLSWGDLQSCSDSCQVVCGVVPGAPTPTNCQGVANDYPTIYLPSSLGSGFTVSLATNLTDSAGDTLTANVNGAQGGGPCTVVNGG